MISRARPPTPFCCCCCLFPSSPDLLATQLEPSQAEQSCPSTSPPSAAATCLPAGAPSSPPNTSPQRLSSRATRCPRASTSPSSTRLPACRPARGGALAGRVQGRGQRGLPPGRGHRSDRQHGPGPRRLLPQVPHLRGRGEGGGRPRCWSSGGATRRTRRWPPRTWPPPWPLRTAAGRAARGCATNRFRHLSSTVSYSSLLLELTDHRDP